jgi:hypothetical protein
MESYILLIITFIIGFIVGAGYMHYSMQMPIITSETK